MKEQLEAIQKEAISAFENCLDTKELDNLRVKFLGKKGLLTGILKQMGKLSAEERPVIGQLANTVRSKIETALSDKQKKLAESMLESKMKAETIDITLPGKKNKLGSLHPLSIVENEIKEIFLGMGFEIADGPEVEYDYYNFEALNLPPDHPARDTQDTFYITDNILLRTQTSSVQVHVMENKKPPIRVIAPGCVYRSDAVDATHSPLFHQIEGLVVDKGITMADLKGTLEQLMQRLYGEECKIRLRPHHFPFTEPSAEMDVTCFKCGGNGCRFCKGSGWIEILGCGMVHPNVLRMSKINPDEFTGFAFGVGLERIALLKYEIDDMRLLYENDVRFLKQF